jgi:Glucose / Sorbosone dehydrogenase
LTALTGLGAWEWLLVVLFALGLVLVVESCTRNAEGSRLWRFLVVPAVSGLALCVALAVAYSDDARRIVDRIGDRGWSVAVALFALITAVAFADLLLGRFSKLAGAALGRLPVGRRRGDLVLVLAVAIPVAVALAGTRVAEGRISSAADSEPRVVARASVRAEFGLAGHPMDILFRTPSSGYVSFREGSIARFELPGGSGGELRLETVATGLRYPRGIAAQGDTLFVAELGDLPCEPDFPVCKGPLLTEPTPEDGERKILRTSRARVLAFRIEEDGTLTDRRVLVADLPVVNTDHGLNDVAVGPGGRIFVSIGHVDLLYAAASLEPDVDRPHGNLLGTVVSFEPDGSDLQVYARGLRNVYGLAFDDDGRPYGADNDGSTQSGWRREEVLAIRRGADYGYPRDGTFGPHLVPREPSLWVLDTVGAGGTAWVRRGDGAATLYVGSGAHLDALKVTEDDDGRVRVADRGDSTRLLDLPGFVTAVQPRPGGLAAAVYAFGGESKLYLLDIDEE